MTKKERMYKQIKKHGNDLIKCFRLPSNTDPIKLCKKLLRLENKAHKLTTDQCNGLISEQDSIDAEYEIRMSILKALNMKPEDYSRNSCPDDCYPVFINGDCRGYALKISDTYIKEYGIDIYKDFGGYGIIAPDFNGEN